MKLSAADQTFKAFLHFMESGTLPHWYENTTHTDFRNGLLHVFQMLTETFDDASIEQYMVDANMVFRHEHAARRLVHQFDKDVVMVVLTFLMRQHSGLEPSGIQSAYAEISKIVKERRAKMPGRLWSRLDAWLIQKIAIPGGTPKLIIAEWFGEIIYRLYQHDPQYVLKSIGKNKVLKHYLPIPLPVPDILSSSFILGMDKPSVANTVFHNIEEVNEPGAHYLRSNQTDESEWISISHAGIILITPYIEQFFKSCKLITDGLFHDRDKAVALLYFLACGNLEYYEYDVFLEKILCDIPEREPIELIRRLSSDELDHAHDLLNTTIENWSVLKGTSVSSLRENFLKREGKITFKEGVWCLQVERHELDVLLDQLPWSTNTIKLPWMKYILRTEWI